MDNSDFKDIEQDGSHATIRIWNHLPVGGRVYLVAHRDSLHVVSSFVRQPNDTSALTDTVVSVDIPAPRIDGGGHVIADSMHEIEVPFTSATVDLLKNTDQQHPLFTRTDVFLAGSNGDTLVATPADYVKVQIIAYVLRHVSTKGND